MSQGSPGEHLEVSVVIPSYASRATILECLRALAAPGAAAPREVIVVDSSNDGTADLIAREFPRVRLLRLAQRTHAGPARNLGAQAATGEMLAFTDADCIPSPDWVARIARARARARSRDETGPILAGAIDNGTPSSRIGSADWLIEFSGALPGLPERQVAFAATANFAVPRALFLSTGGFDDSLTGQDMAFGETLRRLGHSVRFDPDLRVAHHNRVLARSFLARQFALGRGSAWIRRRLPLSGAWIARVPPLVPLLFFYRLFGVLRRAIRAARSTPSTTATASASAASPLRGNDPSTSSVARDGNPLRSLFRSAPWVIAGLGAWTAGFLVGSVTPAPSSGHGEPPADTPAPSETAAKPVPDRVPRVP